MPWLTEAMKDVILSLIHILACVVAVGGGVLDMIVGRDDEFECQAKRKSQHWANYDAGADADAPSCRCV